MMGTDRLRLGLPPNLPSVAQCTSLCLSVRRVDGHSVQCLLRDGTAFMCATWAHGSAPRRPSTSRSFTEPPIAGACWKFHTTCSTAADVTFNWRYSALRRNISLVHEDAHKTRSVKYGFGKTASHSLISLAIYKAHTNYQPNFDISFFIVYHMCAANPDHGAKF